MEVELPQNLSISSNGEELDKEASHRKGQLWTPPVPPEPIRTTNAYGLWARTSAPMNFPTTLTSRVGICRIGAISSFTPSDEYTYYDL